MPAKTLSLACLLQSLSERFCAHPPLPATSAFLNETQWVLLPGQDHCFLSPKPLSSLTCQASPTESSTGVAVSQCKELRTLL